MRLDCPPRCRALLGDPATLLWITEGQKKADALASAGATALALLGVWNLKGKNAFGGVTVLAYSARRLPLIPVETCHRFQSKVATDSD
jgi:hypothetical protein